MYSAPIEVSFARTALSSSSRVVSATSSRRLGFSRTVLLRVMSGGEEAVALAGLEAASAGGMPEGTVGWMVLAAAAASELLGGLGTGAGFMWMGRGLMGLRGLLGLRPVRGLKGTKAVKIYGGCMMQIINSDDNIILNTFARMIKYCKCQTSSIHQTADLESASVLVFFILLCRF